MPTAKDPLSRLVRAIDRWQRQRMQIWEFTDDPECIFRLGVAKAYMGAKLADGTVVRPGDTIGLIHGWNEHVPQIPPTGADLAWARKMKQAFIHSFRLLGHHLAEDPGLADIRAFGGELPFLFTPATTRMLRRLGVEIYDPIPPRGLRGRVVDLAARLWTWLMRRAFNPESTRGLKLSDLRRRPAWISRKTLLALYGPAAGTGES